MPANLTPEYRRAEERFRAAKTVAEKIEAVEEMLRVMPKHKGTDHLQADLRARLSKLRKEPAKKGARGGFSHIIPSEGAGQVALVGPPNSGKSSLVRALTHATPEVTAYPFTTREPVPGMMAFEDIDFQLVDLPPISEQHVEPWVFDLVRHADLVWLVMSAPAALEGFDEVRGLLAGRGIDVEPAGRLELREGEAGRLVQRALIVLTGIDRPESEGAVEALEELFDRRWPILPTSATTGAGLDALRRRTFEAFGIVRVYTKQPGKPRDNSAPFTLPFGSTVGDLAARIHKDVAGSLKFARVWGASTFPGQAVSKEHVLSEGDLVEIHTAGA
ncbi:MAG: GTPase [Vicinamibacterales bacterium]